MERLPVPDLVQTTFLGIPDRFTGVLKVIMTPYVYYVWYKEGRYHRELGKASIVAGRPDLCPDVYYLHGQHFTGKEYWEIMYKNYKGTEHEELCLSHILSYND